MSKLFNQIQVAEPLVEIVDDGRLHDELPMFIGDYADSIDMALEASEMALERMQTIEGMHTHLSTQKLCSASYLNSMQAYSPLIKSMGARMGVKHFPSLEDFSNKHAARDAHSFAVEGLKEMLSKVWEKIKGFFRELFKKVLLFVRRLTGANLELGNYETYCGHLIGKLKANNATIADKSVLISDLPRLLCDANGSAVDSDFVLNQGSVKIKNLVNQMHLLNYGQDSAELYKSVAGFRKSLEAYITKVSRPISQLDFMRETEDIGAEGKGLMTCAFQYTLASSASLPPKVFDEVRNRLGGRAVSSDLNTLAMVNDVGGISQMPLGINMYLIGVNYKADEEALPACVFIGTHHTGSISNKLAPISSLDNLVRFHTDYKASLSKFEDKTGNRAIDALSSEVDKLLSMMQQRFSSLVQATDTAASSVDQRASLENLVKLMSQIKATPGSSMAEVGSGILGVISTLPTVADSEILVISDFCRGYETGDQALIDESIQKLNSGTHATQTYIAAAMAYVTTYLKTSGSSGQITSEELTARALIVRKLQTLLTQVFTQLQILYRGMMVEFYKVYTELRYATVKYIYDSAKRYTY